MEHTPQQIDLLFPALATLEGIYTPEAVKAFGQSILAGVEAQKRKNAGASNLAKQGQLVSNIPVNGESQMTQAANSASNEHPEVTQKQVAMLSQWLEE